MIIRRSVASLAFASVIVGGLLAQSASTPSTSSGRSAAVGLASIQEEPLEQWLTYLSSDELQGRATYTEGLGLAAGYISAHLQQWGVKPGNNGSYLQVVKVLNVRSTSRASATLEVNGKSTTFKDGDGFTLPKNMGGPQTITSDQIVFAGYGLTLPTGVHDDYARLDPKGKVVVWLGPAGPKVDGAGFTRLIAASARTRAALDRGAIATIAPVATPGAGGRAGRGMPAAPPSTPGRGGRGGPPDNGDFMTAQRLDHKLPPAITAQDGFLELLFSGSDVSYADLKAKADRQEPLPAFALGKVRLTINVDADYQVVRTRLTNNVVGIVEGSDPKLKDQYVVYGAHYDHTGYAEGVPGRGGRGGAPAGDPEDRINNGADDDGSGTVAIMAVARAFASGPKPKRSLLFVWHAGEESGLLGSRYNADYPVVPLESMVAQLNMDMVGRNRDNDPKQANTVLVVGSDRISTELHNINEDANASLARPLTLDYEMNDPADTESIYTRSDHYSYAAKGIPIVFYFTGLHPDYHRPSDSVEKIVFDKIVRIAQLAYETGNRVANLERPPVRDNLGPRVGKTVKGKLGVR